MDKALVSDARPTFAPLPSPAMGPAVVPSLLTSPLLPVWAGDLLFPSTSNIHLPGPTFRGTGPVVPGAPDFERIFRTYARQVARWASRHGVSSADLDDVVQEVFEVTYRRLQRYEGEPQLLAWLSRTTTRVAQSVRRRRKRGIFIGTELVEITDRYGSSPPTPFEHYARVESTERVARLMESMNQKYRRLLILSEVEGVSVEELARQNDARVSTVWVWLHRAREQLKRRAADELRRSGKGGTGRP